MTQDQPTDRNVNPPTHKNFDDVGHLDSGERASGLWLRLALLGLVLGTGLAFHSVVGHQFVNWDDEPLIVNNDAWRPLSVSSLAWMFTTTMGGHYQPLTWLSYAIDFWGWGGVTPTGFHLTNLAWHVATAVVFFFVVRKLLYLAWPGARSGPLLLGAFVAAMVFAVHPLRVESVAWVTERRDVLSGFWLMLAVLFYLRAQGETSRNYGTWLAGAFVVYSMSLLSKAIGLSLPVVLLLMDVYPLRRWRGVDAVHRSETTRGVLLEKAVFLVPATLAAVMAARAQQQAGAMWSYSEHSLGLRIGQAAFGLFFYIWKTVLPVGLLPLYEQRPKASPSDVAFVLSLCFVAAVCAVVWMLRRRWPALLVAWGGYVVVLAPVLGFAQSGPQLVADRYSYIACMPWAILFGACASMVWGRKDARAAFVRWSVAMMMVVVIGWLGMLTARQVSFWSDSERLWLTTVSRAPDTGTAHANLASVLNRLGERARARDHSLRALEILPGNRVAHIALARASAALGDYEVAAQHFRTSLSIRPHDTATAANLVDVLLATGQWAEAEELCRRLVSWEPGVPRWRVGLAAVLGRQGRVDAAIGQLQQAVSIDPSYAESRLRLGVLLVQSGRYDDALLEMEDGVRLVPTDPRLLSRLSWMLSTGPDRGHRDGRGALKLALQAATLDPSYYPAYESMAAAQAEVGAFDAAADLLERKLSETEFPLPREVRSRWEKQLAHYRQNKPWRP